MQRPDGAPETVEQIGVQFLEALERGDPLGLASLWSRAAGDRALAELFEVLLELEALAGADPGASPSPRDVPPPGPHWPES